LQSNQGNLYTAGRGWYRMCSCITTVSLSYRINYKYFSLHEQWIDCCQSGTSPSPSHEFQESVKLKNKPLNMFINNVIGNFFPDRGNKMTQRTVKFSHDIFFLFVLHKWKIGFSQFYFNGTFNNGFWIGIELKNYSFIKN
jgi:hypothetical protein